MSWHSYTKIKHSRRYGGTSFELDVCLTFTQGVPELWQFLSNCNILKQTQQTEMFTCFSGYLHMNWAGIWTVFTFQSCCLDRVYL